MSIEFFKKEDGSALLAVRSGPEGWVTRRTTLSNVNLEKLNKLAAAYQLSIRAKAGIALRLDRCRSRFDISDIIDTVSSDLAIARWIGEYEKSISRIADAPTADHQKFAESLSAMTSAADEWAQGVNGVELSNLGFEKVNFGADHIDFGTHHFIARWFRDARLVKEFAIKAKKQLQAQGRPRGLKSWFPGSAGKELRLFGVELPKLYERLTHRPFGITKDSDGANVKKVTGVAFVIDAAAAIGLETSAANVADHFHKARRAGYWEVARSSKFQRRPTRHKGRDTA